MKKLIALIFFTIPFLLQGQSMASIFGLLPLNCTPELNSKQKDALLKNKEYIIPGGDTSETVKYELEIDEAKQYLRYHYYFTTGQKGFNTYEVRKFKKKDGSSLIIFSTYGGLTKAFDQTEIYAFKYQGKALAKLNNQVLSTKIDANIFLRANTPDSIRKKVQLYSSCSYDLSPALKNSIAYRIFFEILDDENQKYLLGDTVLFTWTGESFKQGKVTNSE